VPVRDHEALARAMESFLLHPDLVRSMGQASRRLAERRYDVNKVNADMLRYMGIADTPAQALPAGREPRKAVA
jgi:glycosyltransferase involved in cell wall biosynthesis